MIELKSIEEMEIKGVVEIHVKSFKDFFLTTLGVDFLYIYYNCLRKDPDSILLGIYEKQELSGFCAGTLLSKGFNKKLIKSNFFKLSFIGIRLLLTKPTSLVRLYKNFSKKDPRIQDDGNYSELLSIGVLPEKQGLGIGKKLLIELEREFELKGCKDLSLTTDFYDNENTIQFYKSLGYNVYYDFIAYPNRKMYRLIKQLQ